MKSKIVIFGLLLAVTLLLTASPTLASPGADPPPDSALLTLVSPLHSPEFAGSASPSQFVERANEQLTRLIPILASLKKHGHLGAFQVLWDANAIQVTAPDGEAARLLSGLPGAAGLVPATTQTIQTARAAFRTDLFKAETLLTPALRTMRRAPAATRVIQVNETWDWVQGDNFSGGNAVTAVLKAADASTKDTRNTTVDNNGHFFAQFQADVQAGDSVEVTVGTNPVVTVASDDIDVEFDYDNDTIYGTAGANRQIWVQVRGQDTTGCNGYDQGIAVSAGTGGAYTADFKSQGVDISRHTETDVASTDSNGNQWLKWRHAPYLRVEFSPNNAGGWGFAMTPGADLNVKLIRGPDTLRDFTNPSNLPDGKFGFGFDVDLLPGDEIQVSEGANPLADIVLPTLNGTLNAGKKTVSGTSKPNEAVTVNVRHYNRSNGQWPGACQTVNADATTGAFTTAPFSFTFIGGDNADIFYGWDNGNDLRTWDQVPYVTMYKGQPYLQGNFHWNFDQELSIVVKNSLGAVRYSGKSYAYGGYWEQVLAAAGLPVRLAVGDQVIVTPPAPGKVLTATLVKLTATIDVANSKITGAGPANAHLGMFDNVWMGGNYNCDQCFWDAKADATGQYSFTFFRPLNSGDFVDAVYVDANGNQTLARGFSTAPSLTLKSYPPIFRRGRDNWVVYTVGGNAAHIQNISLGWDGVSRPAWNYLLQFGPDGKWQPGGGPADYNFRMGFGTPGYAYFRGFAWIDGRLLFTAPEIKVAVR